MTETHVRLPRSGWYREVISIMRAQERVLPGQLDQGKFSVRRGAWTEILKINLLGKERRREEVSRQKEYSV